MGDTHDDSGAWGRRAEKGVGEVAHEGPIGSLAITQIAIVVKDVRKTMEL